MYINIYRNIKVLRGFQVLYMNIFNRVNLQLMVEQNLVIPNINNGANIIQCIIRVNNCIYSIKNCQNV